MGHPTEGTEVAEGIGGVAITTLSKEDKATQPHGGQDTLTTPLKVLADSTGDSERQHTIVEVQRVVRAPGRSTIHHLETDDGQTNPEQTCSISYKRNELIK